MQSIVASRTNFPFVVISPFTMERWSPPAVADLLDQVIAKYRVDTNRIYLTGFSMGGFGTWQTALTMSERFAAIAPVAGGPAVAELAPRLRDLPIWIFNGEADNTTTTTEAQQMADALKAVHARVRFTIIPGADHVGSRDAAYRTDELYTWFLEQKRGVPQQPRWQNAQ